MFIIFVSAFLLAIVVSGFCSLMESALYAVPPGHVNILAKKKKKKSGKILQKYKANMSQPVSAILILNTIANTAGAAISGWAAGELYGPNFLVVFSVLFTLAILYCSEIIPKLIGVVYAKEVAPIIAVPLDVILKLLYPLVIVSEGFGKLIQRGRTNAAQLSTSELISLAEMSQKEGSIDELEGRMIKNIIKLDRVLVRDALTPRVVVHRLDEMTRVADLAGEINDLSYSRIPLFSEEKPDLLTSYVTMRDIYRQLLKQNSELCLKDFARPIKTVPELMRLDLLMLDFFEEREHIAAAVDEHGGLSGIITLEDILEELTGNEIVDEYDKIKDLRKYAQRQKLRNP